MLLKTRNKRSQAGIYKRTNLGSYIGCKSRVGLAPFTIFFIFRSHSRVLYVAEIVGLALQNSEPSLITHQPKEHSSPHFYEAWIESGVSGQFQ